MAFKTGPLAVIQQLSAYVDGVLDYPHYGIDLAIGSQILPAQGQDPATVVGVTLHYAVPIVNAADTTQAAYWVDSGNNGAVSVWLTANPSVSLADVQTLDSSWYPPERP